METSPPHATESECSAKNFFDVGEVVFPTPPFLNLSAMFLTCWSRPASLIHYFSRILLTLYYFLLDFALPSKFCPSPLLILSPNHRCLPPVPQCLLSVVSLHLGAAGSHLFMAVMSLWLRLLPLHAPLLLDPLP